jgi:hypothetical protein
MQEALKNTPVFVLFYLVPMGLTYVLPYLGSNSSILNALTFGLNPFFWLHILACLSLVVICSVRGRIIGKDSLLMFPILALIFDFAPLLNLIPFVPTVFHVMAMAVGAGAAVTSVSARRQLPL